MKKRCAILIAALTMGTLFTAFFLAIPHALAETKKQLYTCPMHPQVKSEESGECPICHMKLIPIQDANAANNRPPVVVSKKTIKFYRNPMNPAITSKTPAKDELGMEYIPVYEDNSNVELKHVSGRSSFSISPAQAENLHLQTVKVESKQLSEKVKASARVLSGSSVAIQVMEADASKIKSGQIFSFKSLVRNAEFRGKVADVDSALDPMSRTVRVTGALSNNSGLRSESSGTAVIEVILGAALFVPETSVLRTGDNDLVYVVTGNRIAPRNIQLGAKVDNGFQVTSGLEVGEEISLGPNFLIDSEARIQGAHD